MVLSELRKKISNFPSFSIALSIKNCYIKSVIIFINVKHCTFQIERSIFRIRNVNAYERKWKELGVNGQTIF